MKKVIYFIFANVFVQYVSFYFKGNYINVTN